MLKIFRMFCQARYLKFRIIYSTNCIPGHKSWDTLGHQPLHLIVLHATPSWSIVFSLFWKSHCSSCYPLLIQWSEWSIVFSLLWKFHCSSCHLLMIQWSKCSIVFSLFWKFHCSPCHPVTIKWSECCIQLSFRCYENPIVLHAIHSRFSDRNVPLSSLFHSHFSV